jgi:predicted TIM-barrel fold metal-dependent hydrolase
MIIIDSHMHVDLHGLSLKGIINYLDKKKIDCCWVLSWEEVSPGPWRYQFLPVETVYEAHLKYPSRIIPFYAPDPHKSDAAIQLENWHKKGIRGCGELKATLNWDSNGVKIILQTAGKLKMPVVFHMEESESRGLPYSDAIFDRLIFAVLNPKKKIYHIPRNLLQLIVNNYTPLKTRTKSYIFPGYMLDFASLEMTLRNYPEINFVAHGPMFWKYISADGSNRKEVCPQGPVYGEGVIWRLLREYPHLYADISGNSGLNSLARDPESAKRFLSLFENKILYGTDNVMQGHMKFLNSLGLSKSTYAKIYGGNASKILSINYY